jgi:two-component system nitrogen regulation sensor histidine kinase GlnL
MTPGFALLVLVVLVAVPIVIAVCTFAALKYARARQAPAKGRRAAGSETEMLSAALQDAVSKLKAQEQIMTARAAASEHVSEHIVESLTAGLLVVDRAGLVQSVNPAGRRLLGLPEDGPPVGGAEYQHLLASVPPLIELIGQCLATAEPVARRTVTLPFGSRVSHLGVTVSPLGGAADGRGLICLFSDLTPVYELEEQLRLKEALARLGELTAGIAHEFRNGLATIHGYSRLIRPEELPQVYRPYVDGIRQETEALGHIITNFLNFARPERVAFAPVDLEAVVRRAVDDLRHELPETSVVDVSGAFGTVLGDEVLLRQVFGNLLRNATEACAAVGVAPRVVFAGDMDQTQCRVSVRDNGPGIPEDARERVFQPFFTSRARGTGLGLSIVQKIVVTHNGRVTVGTSEAGGASLLVTLPLMTPPLMTPPRLDAGERLTAGADAAESAVSTRPALR